MTNPAGNILVLTGSFVDLSVELASVKLNEFDAGPDVLDVEVFGTRGRLSDAQTIVLAAAPGQSVSRHPRYKWSARLALVFFVTERRHCADDWIHSHERNSSVEWHRHVKRNRGRQWQDRSVCFFEDCYNS